MVCRIGHDGNYVNREDKEMSLTGTLLRAIIGGQWGVRIKGTPREDGMWV